MQEATDGELMTAIAHGNRQAFREVYRRYAALILGYSVRLLNNRSTAEEVTQEVWLKVVRAAASYRGEGSLKAWLFTVTRRTAFNYMRDHLSDPEVALAEVNLSATDLEEQVLARAEIGRVREAVAALPEAQRVALTLWLTEDLSYGEIASQMQVSEAAVKSLLFRARQNLEHQLRGRS